MTAKFAYWNELPHVLLGMWPADQQSKTIAEHCRQKWTAAVGQGMRAKCHRVTFRMMDEASGQPFHSLIAILAETGEISAVLEVTRSTAAVGATS